MDTNKIIEKIFNFLDKAIVVWFCVNMGSILGQSFGVKPVLNFSLALIGVSIIISAIVVFCVSVKNYNKENTHIEK